MGLLERIRRWLWPAGARAGVPDRIDSGTVLPVPTGDGGVGGFAIIDLETSGLNTARDRVVEIAVISTDHAGRTLDEWTTLVNPAGPVGASHIHGIAPADVRRAPHFGDIIGELNTRVAGRVLVAHNARFDLAFLRTEYTRAGWDMPAAPHLCTLEASGYYLPNLDRRRLTDCCWAAGIRLNDAHSALGDARATAGLLMTYLDPRAGRQPAPEHLHMPALATRIAWPAVPHTPVAVVLRGVSWPPSVPAPASTLAALLDDLPLSAATDEGAPPAAAAYLELVAQVLEDGVLTADEAESLASLAKAYSLSLDQVGKAHRGFLLALSHKAIGDGKITRDERAELLNSAAVLGITDSIVKDILDEAATTLATARAKDCKPLPNIWKHGDPLRIGDGVAFTGCDDLVRARLEGRARAAGLRVTGSVSRRTTVLVTDGADPATTKAQAARRFATRVVTPDVFSKLVTYIQPTAGGPETAAPIANVAVIAVAVEPPVTNHRHAGTLATASGPAIRAWARAQGLPVGVRGRLSADVVAAYEAAHNQVPA